MSIQDIIDELTDKVNRLEEWQAEDPFDSGYDEGYVDGAMHAIELLRQISD
jgi:hypothetical protein